MFKNAYEKLLDITGSYLPLFLVGIGIGFGWVMGVSNLIWYVGDYDANEFANIVVIVVMATMVLALIVKEGRAARSQAKESQSWHQQNSVNLSMAFAEKALLIEEIRKDLRNIEDRKLLTVFREDSRLRIGATPLWLDPQQYAERDWYELWVIRTTAEMIYFSVARKIRVDLAKVLD